VVIDSPVFILAKEMLVPLYLPPTPTPLSLVEITVHVNNAELHIIYNLGIVQALLYSIKITFHLV